MITMRDKMTRAVLNRINSIAQTILIYSSVEVAGGVLVALL